MRPEVAVRGRVAGVLAGAVASGLVWGLAGAPLPAQETAPTATPGVVAGVTQGAAVRVTVRDAGGLPVEYAVVEVRALDGGADAAGAPVARALTDRRGVALLPVRGEGMVRVAVRRVGWRPGGSDPLPLPREGTRAVEVTLQKLQLALDTVRVAGRSACGRGATDAVRDAPLLAVWEQAVSAITTAYLSPSAAPYTATLLDVQRTLTPDGGRVRSQRVTASTALVRQPWRALPPDSLRTQGYVVGNAFGELVFRAPGLDALADPGFAEDHCLQVVLAPDGASVGVRFTPVPARRRRSEIRGTVWLERATAQLRQLAFTFTNVPGLPSVWEDAAGGAVTFRALGDGLVVVAGWEIRMPQLEATDPRRGGVTVGSLVTSGGELLVAHRGADTLFRRPLVAIRGAVTDSASGRPLADARVRVAGSADSALADSAGRFALRELLPGNYTLEVRTAALDAVDAAARFPVTVTDSADVVALRVPAAPPRATALLAGVVVERGSGKRLANAEVSLPELGRLVRTDPAGRFRIAEVPVGSQRLVVRQLGYGPMDQPVRVTAPLGAAASGAVAAAEVRVELSRAVQLDSVSVRAERRDPGMDRFEEHRRLGLGHFVTRDQLEAQQGRKLGNILGNVPGLGIVSGRSGAWPMSKRYVMPLRGLTQGCAALAGPGEPIYNPSKAERLRGITCGCYAQVYLDNQLMNGGMPAEPFDLNEVDPSQLEGIEVYAGPAQTPSEYMRLNSPCGVVVLHTRRP